MSEPNFEVDYEIFMQLIETRDVQFANTALYWFQKEKSFIKENENLKEKNIKLEAALSELNSEYEKVVKSREYKIGDFQISRLRILKNLIFRWKR